MTGESVVSLSGRSRRQALGFGTQFVDSGDGCIRIGHIGQEGEEEDLSPYCGAGDVVVKDGRRLQKGVACWYHSTLRAQRVHRAGVITSRSGGRGWGGWILLN